MMQKILKLMLSPLVLLPIVVLAVYVGIKFPSFGITLSPVGSYYISLMKLIVLPYLFVTITLGIARVASNPKAAEYIRRIVFTYPVVLVFVAFCGLGMALLLPPAGYGDAKSMAALGNMVNGNLSSEHGATDDAISLNKSSSDVGPVGLKILDRFVPSNIFAALSEGDTLKVVIFCIIFGAAMAKDIDSQTEDLFDLFKVVQTACVQVISWFTLMLPFALFSMVAAQVATVGVGPLLSLAPFMITQIGDSILLIALSVVIVSLRANISPWKGAIALRETFTLALTTQSVVACIPTAIREMTTKLGFSTAGVDLLMPLGTTICRIASTQYFVIGAIFAAQIYGIEMDFSKYAMVIVFSVAAGVASSGSSGAVTVVLISIVLDALHLPSEAIIPLLIAVDPIVTMFRVFLLVLGTCATTSIIIPRSKSKHQTVGPTTALSAAE